MSTTAVTPAAAPAAAAPSSAPAAPASVPGSQPSSTPSTSETPSSGSSSPSSTAAPEQSLEQRLQAGWDKAKASVAVEEPPAEVEEPVVPEAEPGTIETAPEGTEPEATPGEGEEAAVAEPTTEETTTEFDDGQPFGPQALSDALKKDEAAQKFFDANPELKGKVFSALRLHEETREIRQLIPDIETAKTAVQGASLYQNFDNDFLGAETVEGAKPFVDRLIREAMFVDEKGQPVMEDGKYKIHPAIGNVFQNIFDNKLTVLREQAEQANDERVLAALDVLREVSSPSSPGLEDVPEELRPQAEALKQREAALKTQQDNAAKADRDRQQAAHLQSIDHAESKAADSVHGQLKPLFAKASLSEPEQEWALGKIGEEIDAALEQNALYQSTYNSILREPPSEAREQKLTKHMLRYTQEVIGPIATKIVRDAKSGAVRRQEVKQEKVAAQTNASRTDPKSATTTVARNAPAKPGELRQQIIAQYKAANNGADPDSEYITQAMWKAVNGPKK